MPEGSSTDRKPRAARTAGQRRRLRSALAVAALDLFATKGYDATTVEDIVEAVGVGRRTFFRYFRSKEEVVFPDHDERLTEVVNDLERSGAEEPPMRAVRRTAERVLEMYLAEPEISLKRFELTRQVPSLRDREIVSIDRYQRVFARYLRQRYAGTPEADLRAAVEAASVVATHNHVLRRWLKSGGTFDAHEALRRALAEVGMGGESHQLGSEGESDQVVVGVLRTRASAETVRDRIERALGDLPGRE
ncbi:TetR family transcriptional regulator [Actinopolyspora mortivallis]|uniref:TetR family transcriptional regulator n=1 Tax=Actinopolyspora mortivallis TaxID=33906 RepID=A0A2T0GVA0_ACTMO|nr:TetR family transcriptional regulator [Actinopolyspora mortivallis]PRW63039.1 TetR family transcriptional regulator [Actinopolyspora mortivallis]